MAAGLGFKTFTSGEVLTAADTNGYLMQGINVFANASARTAAITSPQEGQYSFLKDTNALEYYDGAAWVGAPVGDITAVTAGKGLTGGGSSGDVTVSLGTTAKGDLVAGSGASTAAVLTVGSNGETLVADSSTSTGLRYQGSMAGGKNAIINGGFDIWQRGTTTTGATSSANGYAADRWQIYRAGYAAGATLTRQATGDTTNLPFIQYCARVQRDSGNTSTASYNLSQNLESSMSIPYAGKTFVLSFYARAGANYSAASSNLRAIITNGTGTDQNGTTGAGYTGSNQVIYQNVTLTTTWQRFSITATMPTNATEFLANFEATPVGTAGAADYFEVTGVQVEVGSVATQFSRAGGTIQGELAACQRYYWRFGGDNVNQVYATGLATGTTTAAIVMPNPVPMRIAPTSIDFSTLQLTDYSSYANALTGLTITAAGRNASRLDVSGCSGLTATRIVAINSAASSSGYVGLSAEL